MEAVMSLVEFLEATLQSATQSVLSSVATFEQSALDQEQQVQTLSARVADLSAENEALRAELSTRPAPAPAPSPVPTPLPTTPGGPPPTGTPIVATEWGFAANGTDPLAGLRVALPRMKADGGAWLRLWHSHFGPISPTTAGLIDLATAAGVKVILCVQPKDTQPASLGVPDFATFVARNAPVLKKLAYVEAGNELNLVQYRPDDLGSSTGWPGLYVRRWLKPMYLALQSIGVKTMCTSLTEPQHPERTTAGYIALRNAGAPDWCDAVALHCYVQPTGLPATAAAVDSIRRTWNKPVHVTEANIYTRGLSKAEWAAQFSPYAAMLKTAGVASVCFYRGFAKPKGKWSWPVLFDANGVATDAYDQLLAAMR
jgi:hypothetical protein